MIDDFEFEGKPLEGIVMCWLPASDEDAALFKVFYVDGDYEDYEEHELQVAMDCYKNYSSQG